MAQDRPTKQPRWASAPPAPPPTTITEPTEPEKDAGWQPGKPRRQYMNWLQNLIWQWSEWFDQAFRRTFDIFPDQALPAVAATALGNTTPPTTGAGLAILAGDFSGRGYILGYEIGPILSPAFTYGASKDTYWDLSRGGTWTAVAVNNGAGEPAVTANSIRFYKVVTDATNRTSVEDRRQTKLQADVTMDLNRTIRFGDGRRGSLAQYAEARQQTRFKGGAGAGYTLIHESLNDSGALYGTRRYIRHTDLQEVVVAGASWDGANWTVDPGNGLGLCTMLELTPFAPYWISLVTAGVFSDASWFAAMSNGGPTFKGAQIKGQLEAGGDLNNNAFERANTARFKSRSGSIRSRALEGESGFNLYNLSGDTQGTGADRGRGGEWCSNCFFDGDTSLWTRISSGKDAYKLEITSGSCRLLKHALADAATWADTVAAGTWSVIVEANSSVSTLAGELTVNAGSAILPATDSAKGYKKKVNTGSTARWLVDASEDTNTGRFVRKYVKFDGSDLFYEDTINALWTGTQWINDVVGLSSLFRHGPARIDTFYKNSGAVAAWNDSVGGGAWDRLPYRFDLAGTANSVFQSAIIDFQNGVPLLQGNPPYTAAQQNKLMPKNVCKAWVRFRWNASANPQVLDGYNVFGVGAAAGPAFTTLITYAQAMADVNHIAVATLHGAPIRNGVTSPAVIHAAPATTGVNLLVYDLGGLALDPTLGGATGLQNAECGVAIFGVQT